ncbi:MAG TPA: glycosyltransferase family 39 protein [Chthonomonadaceae bacterium]|nr:glycosyltransferase family 39 protein [Chthonomonadaceae bacterium]
MERASIFETLLAVDPRWLVGLCVGVVYYLRPALARVPSSATYPQTAGPSHFTLAIAAAADRDAARLARAVVAGMLVWIGLGVAPLFVQSLQWPLVHDGPIMHYVAWRISNSAVPYRDVYDMNLPGVYVIHLLILKLLGSSDTAFRHFDLIWLAITGAFLFEFCYPVARWWGGAAVLVFAGFHLSNGAPGMAQRDLLEFTFLLAGLLLAVRGLEAGGDWRRLAVAGAAIGCAAAIKPLALLLAAALIGLAIVSPGLSVRRRWLGSASVCAGAALPLAVFAFWLAMSGGLRPFTAILAGVMPLYARMHDRPFAQYLSETWVIWLPCLLTAPAAVVAGRPDIRRLALIAGVAYGALHYVLQGKGWPYQLYPLVGFACALAACNCAGMVRGAKRPAIAIAASTLTLLVLGVGCWQARLAGANALTADTLDTVVSIERDLGPRLRRADTVQCFDTTGGCSHAMMRLGRPLATRFLCDFLLYGDARDPYLRSVQRELISDLAARPPEYLIVYRWGWPHGQYDRIARFPELAAFVRARYRVDTLRAKYVIYRHEDTPESGR